MNQPAEKLLKVSEAQQRLLSFFTPSGQVKVPLLEAAGRVLAEEVVSDLDLPPFSNSSMDGFALLCEDVGSASLTHPVELAVVADIPAGQVVTGRIGRGQAARIMTGAPLPNGATAVIPVEDTDFNQRQAGVPVPSTVKVYRKVSAGENVRPRGQDVRAGETVLPPGRRLRPQEIGFLSMLGKGEVSVWRRPKVAVLSSGDELVPAGAPLAPGKIHDSNTYTLVALVEEAGGETVSLGILPDQFAAVQAGLDLAVERGVDLILSSAGVSVGAFDFVRTVVQQQGNLDFWRVNMRPGKPLAFGHYQGVPFVGLPGNPVSAFVGFEVFVRPALAHLSGDTGWQRVASRVMVMEPIESDGRESYLRAEVQVEEGRLVGRLTGHQGSGNLRSLVQANALLVVPSGVKSLPAGAELEAWLFGDAR